MSGVKGKLKYISGICIFLSLEIVICPIVTFGKFNLSVIDIIRILLNQYELQGVQVKSSDIIREYMQNFIFSVLFWVLFTLLIVLLITLIQSRMAYIAGVTGQIVEIAFAVALYIILQQKLEGLKQVTLFAVGETTEMKSTPVFVWGGLQALALIINIAGIIVTYSHKKEEKKILDVDELFPQDRPFEQNMYQKQEFNQKKKTERKRIEFEAQVQKRPVEKRTLVTDIRESNSIEYGNDTDSFEGVILGLEKIYKGKIFKLNALEVISICGTDGQVRITREEVEDKEIKYAEIYYIPQYREYCVIPQKRKCIILESGQPLGANRQYYIPRGEKIKVQYGKQEEKMLFELA